MQTIEVVVKGAARREWRRTRPNEVILIGPVFFWTVCDVREAVLAVASFDASTLTVPGATRSRSRSPTLLFWSYSCCWLDSEAVVVEVDEESGWS